MSIPNIPGFRKDYNPYLKQIGIPRSPCYGDDNTPKTSRDLSVSGNSLLEGLPSRPTTAPSSSSANNITTTGAMSAAMKSGNNKISFNATQPKWVTTNDCLRFYAYFEEEILEGGGVENSTSTGIRIRKFVIYYYVVDDTIMIDEPKVRNSGLPQGVFMKRQRLVKPKRFGRGYYSEKDFLVGGSVEIYGRIFKIVNADNATREYMENKYCISLASPIDYPLDMYAQNRAIADNKALIYAQGNALQEIDQQDNNNKPLPYTERDNKVLCFRASFVELVTGDIRPIKVYYYVTDDTLEIKETVEDGRMQCANMLKRQRLPKGSMVVPTGLAEGGNDPQRESFDYVTWKDLNCGKLINIYGRDVMLVDCDGTTRKWYQEKGIVQVPLQVKKEKFSLAGSSKATPPSKSAIAPPNGYGTDDDLYALGFKLEPKKYEDREAMKENLHKDKDTLRMIVNLVKADGSLDTHNTLLLNYFPADNSISLFAPEVRNSGVWGGLFLARAQYKKHLQYNGEGGKNQGAGPGGAGGNYSRPLATPDFLPGSGDIVLEAPKSGIKLVTLRISSYDEYSLSKLSTFDSPLDGGRIKNRFAVLGEKAALNGVNVRNLFSGNCNSSSTTMTKEEFTTAIKQLEQQCGLGGAYMTPEDIDVLMSTYSSSNSMSNSVENDSNSNSSNYNTIAFNDVVDGISLAAPRSVREQSEEIAGKLAVDALFVMKKFFRSRLMNTPANGGGNLRKMLRDSDLLDKGVISFDSWAATLQKSGLIGVFTKETASSILLSFDTTSTNTLDYNALCDAVFNGDFELPVFSSTSSSSDVDVSLTPCADSSFERNITVSPQMEQELYQGMTKAMSLFASSFNRFNRKRILRKHWMAFDGERTGRISREQFLAGIDEAIGEFDLDIDWKAMTTLALFLFPHSDQSKVFYDALLDAICMKNMKKCIDLKREGLLAGEMAGVQLFKADNSARARDFGGSLKVVGLSNHN